jgi:FixJ family two-component response regulator
MSAGTADCARIADRHHGLFESISAVQTVFIVDDIEENRLALTRLLVGAGYQVRAFESAVRFFKEHDSEAPGCLLLENCMPDMSGLEAQRFLNRSEFARPIIFLTGHGDIQTSVQAMKQGAVDFLTKPIDEDRLLAAVDQATQLDLAARHNRAIRRTIDQRLRTLTPRQREIMEQIVRGRLNKQIAFDLGIVEKDGEDTSLSGYVENECPYGSRARAPRDSRRSFSPGGGRLRAGERPASLGTLRLAVQRRPSRTRASRGTCMRGNFA